MSSDLLIHRWVNQILTGIIEWQRLMQVKGKIFSFWLRRMQSKERDFRRRLGCIFPSQGLLGSVLVRVAPWDWQCIASLSVTEQAALAPPPSHLVVCADAAGLPTGLPVRDQAEGVSSFSFYLPASPKAKNARFMGQVKKLRCREGKGLACHCRVKKQSR